MTDCQIDLNNLYSKLNNPTASANFLNPNYTEPAGAHGEWSIKITYNGTAYQFGYFYVGETLEITSTFGERGFLHFQIADYDEDETILPFIPVEEMLVQVYNGDEDRLYFEGYIRDVLPMVTHVRDDYTEAGVFTISCKDLYSELEREPIYRVYEDKTLGFIARDVIFRYTNLDASDIDATLGFTVERYPVNKKYASQVISHIADLTETTYVIDPNTRKITLVAKDDGTVKFPLDITDANVYNYFDRDTFSVRRQTDALHNVIDFEFSERYSEGTVNVSNGSNIVVGFGSPPETDWDDFEAGIQFKLAASDAVYNVEKNNSAGATQELRLTSNFAESTASDQAYELRGHRRSVRVSDSASIGLMKSVRGDSGRFVYMVSEDQNYFTYAEARRFAQALLALARPLPQGGGTTYNSVFGWMPMQAGKTLKFNLPNSKRFVGTVVVQQITIRDLGGHVEAEDNIFGERHPFCQIDMSWTATFNNEQTQMRKMMQDLRKVKVNVDDVDNVRDIMQINEILVFQDCIHARTPIQITENLQFNEFLEARVEDLDDPLYYTDYDYFLNGFDYAFTSD